MDPKINVQVIFNHLDWKAFILQVFFIVLRLEYDVSASAAQDAKSENLQQSSAALAKLIDSYCNGAGCFGIYM